jgi:secreted Zn-dependent insulinase-like peptidase
MGMQQKRRHSSSLGSLKRTLGQNYWTTIVSMEPDHCCCPPVVPFMYLLTVTGTKITLEKTVQNPENVNSGIEYFCHATSSTDTKTRARLYLLAQISEEKAFDFLRTKLQLGYWVSSGVRNTVSTEGYK